MSKQGKAKNNALGQVLKGRLVISAWEKELLRATRSRPNLALARKLREARRLRISEAARRNGMTYNQFMSAVRHYDPSAGGAGMLGDRSPRWLDRLAVAAKASYTELRD